jgi:hypothetical protein
MEMNLCAERTVTDSRGAEAALKRREETFGNKYRGDEE